MGVMGQADVRAIILVTAQVTTGVTLRAAADAGPATETRQLNLRPTLLVQAQTVQP